MWNQNGTLLYGDAVSTVEPRQCPGALVSVIVPAFNAAHCLEASIATATAQTVRDLEVLIVNDGSTDRTLDVALEIARGDARVRVLSSPLNSGAGRARNAARAAARGVWLAGLDADDAWLPNRLEVLLSTPGAEVADVIADDVLRIDPQRGTVWSCLLHRWQAPLRLTAPTWLSAADLVRHHLGVLQPLIRRTFLEAHRIEEDETLPFAEDFYLGLDLLLARARWLQVPQGYYLYVARPDSLSTRHATHGAIVLAQHSARLCDPRVERDAEVRAAVEEFIAEERVSLLVESARQLLRRPAMVLHEPRALWRLVDSPGLLLPALTHCLRRFRARIARRRAQAAVLSWVAREIEAVMPARMYYPD